MSGRRTRHQTARSIRKLLDAWELSGEKPLSRSFARSLLAAPKHMALEEWLQAIPRRPAAARPAIAWPSR